MSHQKAAYSLLTELYTPQTMMQHPTLRNILKWYLHFDFYVAMLSGNPSIIGRDWLVYQQKYYEQEVNKDPDNIVGLYEEVQARTRLTSNDVFGLLSMHSKGLVTDTEFEAQAAILAQRIEHLETKLPPQLKDSNKLVTDFTGAPPRHQEDIVDPYEPGVIWGGDLFPTNQYMMGVVGLKSLFETRLAAFKGIPPKDPAAAGWKVAKVVDAIKHWPGSPPGALISFRSILGLASFLLPPQEKEKLWLKKMLAAIEVQG